jgi:eukaryotic-like serine/threonine-protein kinase
MDEQPDPQETVVGEERASEAAIFPAGKILESRFRILRTLGHGGMGEVYEAEDLILKENVALKTLLPQIAADEHFRIRFRREVLLARKVTHPNVCRIFEVFGDALPSTNIGTAAGSPPFMTMELLRGQTLSQYLQEKESIGAIPAAEEKKRRLTTVEALPLVSQMVAALNAAHQVGVVHRDFKSSNVFLATGQGPGPVRVVVTDFGLARLAESEGASTTSFTGQNEFVGTPLYMSPEQVEGGEITPATDIYALGVVLYEMVTGTWPFMGHSARETASLRLKGKPVAPKQLVPALEDRWNSVILRCLERDPNDRFRTVEEVLESLIGETVALRRRTQRQRELLLRRLKAAAVFLAFIAMIAGAYHWWPRHGAGGPITSIAVVGFQNLSQNPDKNWIGTSLEEVLTRDLAAGENLRVTPAADVARMRQELDIPPVGAIDDKALDRLRGNLGVDRLVVGAYELSGQPSDEQIRLTLRVLDSSSGGTPLTMPETGHEADIFGLSDRIARDLRTQLKLGDISTDARMQARAALQNNPASRAYFDGLQKLRQFDPHAALEFLGEAVEKNPDSPLPHLALSEAWDILGYDGKALDEAKRAEEKSNKVSEPEQRAIECRVLELQRSWDDAIAKCRGLWMFRKDLDDGLRLAAVQFSAQRWKDALATLDILRKELPVPDNADPRIDLSEAINRNQLTQYKEMESAASAAHDKANQKNARVLQAHALLWSCVAKQNLDELPDAQKDCTTADELYSTIGDKIGEARAVTNLAHIRSKLSDSRGAADNYEKALDLAKKVGSMRDRCDALLNYGDALNDANKLDDARQKYEESLEVAQLSGNQVCQAHSLENLATVAGDKHEFAEAIKKFDQAQKLYSELGMSADLARLESNLGVLLWEQGDPPAARAHLEDAANRRRQLGLRDGLGLTLVSLGDVLLAQDEVDKALGAYREAAQIQSELKEDDDSAVTQASIAAALVEKGESEEAESIARKIVSWSLQKEDKDYEVFARDVLVRSLLAQENKKDEAVNEAKTLEALLPKANQEETRLSARTTIARALAAQHSFSLASSELLSVLAEARRHSFLMEELSAGVALAEAEKLQGVPTSLSSLRALAATAKTKGYLLLARKFSSLLGSR